MAKEIKKILLIVPRNAAYVIEESKNINFGKIFPIGIAYVAGALEQAGYAVDVLDAAAEGFDQQTKIDDEHVRVGLSDEQVVERIRLADPDLVGISNLFSMQINEAQAIAGLCKKTNPEIVTVMGGANPSVLPERVLENMCVDYVVLGEGEKTIVELIGKLNERENLADQAAIGFRRTDGTIQVNRGMNYIENVDGIPLPAYHLFNIENYFGAMAVHGKRETERFMPVITSRGCPMGCTFCTAHNVWGKKYRARSPESVVSELKMLKQKYGIEEIIFEDDNITLDKKRAEKLFDLMIFEKLNLIWTVPNGIALFTVDENLLKKMKQAGCYKVNFAVESGCQRVLDQVIKKPLNLTKLTPLIKYARDIGLQVGAFFIVGLPGETLAEIRQSFRYMRKHKLFMANISVAMPLPGSELYKQVVDNNYFIEQTAGRDLIALHPRSFLIQTPDWTSEQLHSLLRYETAKTKIYIILTSPKLFFDFLARNGLKYIFYRIRFELGSLLHGLGRQHGAKQI